MVTWAYAAILAWSVAVPAPAVSSPPAVSSAAVAPVTPVVLPMPRPEQVMAVPPELHALLQQQVIAVGGSGRSRLERLTALLTGKPPGLGISYSADATLTVDEAYRTRKANCLTFTLLIVALAREAGLQSYGQALDDVVTWGEGNDIAYRLNHVNAGVVVGRSRLTVDAAADQAMGRNPPKPISDQRLLALYYNNRTAELLATSAAAAAPYAAMALQLAPRYANAWVNAGVVQLLQGDRQAAERDLLKALALDPDNEAALLNLVALYRNNGDEARHATYARRLEKVQVKDPYFHFLKAQDDEKRGDYAGAVQHFRRAIHLYDGDSRFYLGLARAYQLLGEARHARQAMARAAALDHGNVRGSD